MSEPTPGRVQAVFTVRKSSDRAGFDTFYVHRQGRGRVTVHAHGTREAAQAEANALNKSIVMTAHDWPNATPTRKSVNTGREPTP